MARMHHGERFNTSSHLAALVLVLVGAVPLLAQSAGSMQRTVGAAVFTLCAALLYAASTLYHATRGRAKRLWQRMDHCAIYLLVAGSYTPFAVAGARHAWDWALLASIWLLAVVGIATELRSRLGAQPPLSLYLAFGWLCVAGVALLAGSLTAAGLAWLGVGALAYSVGTVFYVNRSGWRHAHGTWHLFVLFGTACHYGAVASLAG
ncbi:hemolysin III family protein [soil metagenome]